MAIKVNGNTTASCDACGNRPDTLIVTFTADETSITLCDECGIKLVKAVSGWMSLTSSKWKQKIKAFFK
jgi:stalled ribosome rescue protein Dom34